MRDNKIIEFKSLEEFADHIGYAYPEEIHIVAACEGFYDVDDQGDHFLSAAGINDFLQRLHEPMRVVGLSSGILCELLPT